MGAMKIAIVGSGISGLTAAYLINKKHDVTIFEGNDYVGGHTHTVTVTLDDKNFQVDTGFIVCNDRNYPNFLKLMQKLNVDIQPTEMSFSVRNSALGLEYNGHNFNTLFSQRKNFLRTSFYSLVSQILRFNKVSKLAIEGGLIGDTTLDDFVAEHNFSDVFKDNYLLPVVAAIW